jgi:hypothetical protein
VAALVVLLAAASISAARTYSAWGPAVNVESIAGTDSAFNSPGNDGCPALTRDGLQIYMASTRLGGFGGIDLWVASR